MNNNKYKQTPNDKKAPLTLIWKLCVIHGEKLTFFSTLFILTQQRKLFKIFFRHRRSFRSQNISTNRK